MDNIKLVSYKNGNIEDALKEARKISAETSGNEAIVDLGDGNLAIVSINENEEEISSIADNNDKSFEDKIKGKLQEANLNTSAEFNPKVMEFSVQENSFFGLFKKVDKTINYSNKEVDVVDNNISNIELRSKNEFNTLKEAESAAKDRTGTEAVVYDEKTNKFYLVKISNANLEKYTKLDENGNRIFRAEEDLDSILLDIEKSKGKKIVSILLPDKILGLINTKNILRRTEAENIQNINLNTEKEEKINVDINSLEEKIKSFSNSSFNFEGIKNQKTKILLDTIRDFGNPSSVQNLRRFVEESDSLFVNTSATKEEKQQIRTQIEQGFKDIEVLLSKISQNASDQEIQKFMRDNPNVISNIMSIKYASEFTNSNFKDGSIGNILLEKNRIEQDLTKNNKFNTKEIHKKLLQSKNLSNSEKLFLASIGNEFLEKKLDNKLETLESGIENKLKSIKNKLSDLDVNNVLDDIAQNGINSTNIQQLKEFINIAKNSNLNENDTKIIRNLEKNIKKYESSKLEADLSIQDAISTNQKFIDKLIEIQRTSDPNDRATQGLITYLLNVQEKYDSLLKEDPPNSIKIAMYTSYINNITNVINNVAQGIVSLSHGIQSLENIEKKAIKLFSEFDRSLEASSINEAKEIMINAYREFAENSASTENFETLVNNNPLLQRMFSRNNNHQLENENNQTSFRINTSGKLPTSGTGISSNSTPDNSLYSLNIPTLSIGVPNNSTVGINRYSSNIPKLSTGISSNYSFLNNSGSSTNSSFLNIGNSLGYYNSNYFLTQTQLNLSMLRSSTSRLSGGGYSTGKLVSPFSSNLNNLNILNDLYNMSKFSSFNSIGIKDLFTTMAPYINNIQFSSNNLNSKLFSLDSKYSNIQKNLSKINNSYSLNSDNAVESLEANLTVGRILNQQIDDIERSAELLEEKVEELYSNFDDSSDELVSLLESFREIINKAENKISDIKTDIKKKLTIQLSNIMNITDSSKRRKLLDKLKTINDELFIFSREVQFTMKSYMEKSLYLSLELKKEDAKKVLESYKKVLESYNTLKNENDPEKFLEKLDKYNQNLKILSNFLEQVNDNKNSREKFKLLDGIF